MGYDFPPAQTYSHPISGLTYSFENLTNPPENLLALETTQEGKTFRFLLDYRTGLLFKAEIWVTQTMEKLILTGQRNPNNPMQWLIQWDFGTYGAIVYLINETGELNLQSTTITDCSALAHSDIYIKLLSLADFFSSSYLLDDDVPPHFVQATLILFVGASGPRMLNDCQSWLEPKLCDWKTSTWAKCKKCCEDQANAWSWLVGSASILSAPYKLISAGLTALGVLQGYQAVNSECYDASCVGKTGDPNCQNPQACTGECKGVCIGGWSHACGSCPDPQTPNCCTN